jgi:hypothetical protein
MPETPQQFFDRVSAAAAACPDGRLAVPTEIVESEIFPFESDALRVKAFEPPVVPEPPRVGDPGGEPCRRCERGDEGAFWSNERWTLSPAASIKALPFAAFLEPRAHLDVDELDAAMSAEFGRLLIAAQRAVNALDHIGRVHVYIWGDGARHMHVWLMARPLGLLQLRGSNLPDWTDVLPPVPADQRTADERTVAEALRAEVGGDVLSR